MRPETRPDEARRDKATCTTPHYIPTLYIKLCAHNQSLYAAWYCCWAPRANKSVYL